MRERERKRENTHKERHAWEYARLLFLTFSLSRNALCRGNKSIIFTIYTKDTSVKKRKRKKTKSYCITLDGLRLGKFRSLTHNYSTQRHRSDPPPPHICPWGFIIFPRSYLLSLFFFLFLFYFTLHFSLLATLFFFFFFLAENWRIHYIRVVKPRKIDELIVQKK